jgi:serine protease
MFIKFIWLALLMLLHGCDSNGSTATSTPDSTQTPTATYTLSGRITVANNTAHDIDVNDSSAPYVRGNDTFATAQAIPNPVILGGYVNQPNTGAAGRSKVRGDVNDFYSADLRKGQAVNLFIAQATLGVNDLDLMLLDSNAKAVDASVGESEIESVVVPANGRYYIQVNAVTGASNYVLSIGQQMASNAQNLRLSSEFVPNQAIVEIQPQSFSAQSILNSFSALGMTTQSADSSRAMLFQFDPTRLHSFATDDHEFATPELREKYNLLMQIKQLRSHSEVTTASPNYLLKMLRVPNDPQYRYQWNYTMLNLPQAWDMTTGDSNVVVAVIDTGVLLNHPDIQGKTVAGYDFIADTRISLDGDGLDDNPNDPGDQGEVNGNSTFHGTHVAGTIAAATNNAKGVAGVGWNTRIMPLRVLGKGGAGDDYSIEQAIRFAAGLSNDSGKLPAKKADVINLSLGGAEVSSSFRRTITDAYNVGVVIVAASGNDGTSVPMYPAALTEVISTGAVDINKQHPDYSNYGTTLKVVAPGGARTADLNGDGIPDGIMSTVGKDEKGQELQYSYETMIGTSMASPHVAGVVALMKAVNPLLTPKQVNALLASGKITEDLGSSGRDDFFGYGLINAQKAVYETSLLIGGSVETPQPQLVVNPSALNFGLTATTATLTLVNAGGGDLQLQRVSENSTGFLSVVANSPSEYVVTVNRKGLNSGTYSATISFESNVNTVNIPIILQVGDPNNTGDAGHHYVLLVDATTKESVQELDANATNGIYEFSFSNVPKGTYLIVAGTDMNNDAQICDGGEACGAYLTSSDPISLDVTKGYNDLNFDSGFNVVFTSQALSEGFVPIAPPTTGFARPVHETHTIAE